MRPSHHVYNRVLWDDVHDPIRIVVGYMDRFEGIKEISFKTFQFYMEGRDDLIFIPWHRVWYFKRLKHDGETEDVMLWDRRSRVDNVFNSA